MHLLGHAVVVIDCLAYLKKSIISCAFQNMYTITLLLDCCVFCRFGQSWCPLSWLPKSLWTVVENPSLSYLTEIALRIIGTWLFWVHCEQMQFKFRKQLSDGQMFLEMKPKRFFDIFKLSVISCNFTIQIAKPMVSIVTISLGRPKCSASFSWCG